MPSPGHTGFQEKQLVRLKEPLRKSENRFCHAVNSVKKLTKGSVASASDPNMLIALQSSLE